MSHERPSTRPTAAERQNVRAVAVQAASQLAAAEYTRNFDLNPAEFRVAVQQWTHEVMFYIENGRWSDDQPTR